MSPEIVSGAPLSPRRKLVIYLAVLAGMFMAVLDMNIIATALPTIADDLGDLQLFGWVGAAYLLTTAAVTTFYGKLGDLFGRKRIFMTAIGLFVVGSLACGLAWSMPTLIAARVLQALGGGGLMTSAFAIIADLFEPRERARYQGYSSVVFTISSLVGPVAGGFIAQAFGWEYIFLINVPIGIAVIAVVALAMPAHASSRTPVVDYAGGLLLAAAVSMLVFWAENVLSASGGPLAYLLPLLTVLALVAFVMVERRAAEPILPLSLLRNSTIALTLAMSILMGITTLGMLNYFVLFMQMITGLPPAEAGLLFMPTAIGSLLASVTAGTIISRTGRYKIFPILGMGLGVLVMIAYTFIDAATPYWAIGLLTFFFSICMGLQMQTLMVAVQAAAPRRDVGAATGALTLARMIGASLGLTANGALLQSALWRQQDALPADVVAGLPAPLAELTPNVVHALPPALVAPTVDAFHDAFSLVLHSGAVLFGICFVLAWLLKDVRLPVHAKAAMDEDTAAAPAAVPAE